MRFVRLRHVFVALASIAAVSAVGLAGPLAGRGADKSAAAASRPHGGFGSLPESVGQTITKQNSPTDKLRVDITHSRQKDGSYVAFVRLMWGDLDNAIQGGGSQYYSDWDGKVTLHNGTASVLHKIQFDDGGKVTTHPANAALKPSAARVKARAASRPAGPGAGSGKDELEQSQGQQIVWKSGVVGAMDGLLIRVTSDTGTVNGTIVAGKFTIPFTITPGAATGKGGILSRLHKKASPATPAAK